MLELVGELDLSAFAAAYRGDGRGRPPYDPRMMLALVVYCRGKGICSGRGIEAACHDDLGARVINLSVMTPAGDWPETRTSCGAMTNSSR